tara:strand:- start:23862 stop:24554 length:693 start_codon:yes stop_codon:yes gene_type:complete
MIFLLLLFTLFSYGLAIPTILLNSNNSIVLKGPVNHESASRLIHDFNMLPDKNNTVLFLNTPGGSVDDGMKIVSELKKYNVDCIAETAYSMGFIIFQSCKNRYILPHGKLMQHQMYLGIQDQKSRIDSYMRFIDKMEHDINKMQAKRINITVKEFKKKINNDWWLYGKEAVKEKCADKLVNVECSQELTKKTEKIDNYGYKFTYSKCPLISNYIKKEKIKNDNKEFVYLI